MAAALLGILLLMWPALVNGVPFVFSDTTAYVRAGDMAANIATHGHAHTAWTRAAPPPLPVQTTPVAAPTPAPVAAPAARGNDPASGTIMAGRSPYFGLLLWLGYVSSDFWLFVIAQAAIAYWLIGLTLRAFGVLDRRAWLLAAALLGLVTPLSTYTGILLADALAGFGLLAFLLLTGSPVGRWERAGLILIILLSAISHLTHIVMLATMTAVLALFGLFGRRAWSGLRAPIAIGVVVTALGLASVALTGAVVKAHFGKAPALIPLTTARLIADGPGRSLIESGCDGGRFAVCHIPYRGWTNGTKFLWSTDPATGGYLTADPATRQAMAAEDTAFARAVLRHAPLATVRAMAWNTILQLADFRATMFTQSCFAEFDCAGAQFPDRVRERIARSPGGHDLWPARAVTVLHYLVVIGSIAALAILFRVLPTAIRRRLALWIVLLAVAMIVNAFLGGAVSEPQSRYQARIVWLIPLFAIVAALVRRRPHLIGEGA